MNSYFIQAFIYLCAEQDIFIDKDEQKELR
jgi:hypothetical protein